ncbi:MAG: MG2 domain-containing protein, partial [Anaerolineales bacterium]|nr:MG2 domain-containing protein [Anaerolineales bacterium]
MCIRDRTYTALLSATSQALGGVSLQQEVRATWQTLPPFDLLYTNPANDGEKSPYESVWFYFSSPTDGKGLEKYFRISPAVTNFSIWWDDQAWAATLSANFDPSQNYIVEVSPDLTDVFGQKLGRPVQISFRTAPLPPNLTLSVPSSVLWVTSDKASVPAQAVNLPRGRLASGSLSVDEFIRLQAPDNYSFFRDFRAADHQTWEQAFELATNRNQRVEVSLQPNNQPRSPGLYYLDIEIPLEQPYLTRYLIVVSDVHLTYKLSPQEALVWAVDSESLKPLANAPIVIYDENGAVLAQGQTDGEGIFRKTIPALEDPWRNSYAVISQPGDPSFGLTMPRWSAGVDSWEFNIPFQFSPPSLKVYLYTDRPIYRPGQTVYLRAIVRQAFNARYTLPEIASLPLRLLNPNGQEIATLSLPISEFGTASGEFSLPSDAQPGTYSIDSPLAEYQSVYFEVATYRKPQIELTFDVEQEHLQAGESLTARLSARYFFDAPASKLPIHWALYWQEEFESLAGYSTGEAEKTRFNTNIQSQTLAQLGLFTNLVAEGDAQTDATGILQLSIPTEKTNQARRYILEVTATDESGLPVSGRTSIFVHPAPVIIGIKPDVWFGKVNTPLEAEVLVADWQGQPIAGKALRAEFATIRWIRDETQIDLFGLPVYLPQTEVIGSADLVSGSNGLARLAFTPEKAGTYLLSVEGEGARSSVILWIGGSGEAVFPNFPNQRLQLVADRGTYQAGETARIFIPNPFPTVALALVSFERSTVMGYELRQIPAGGIEIERRLSPEDVPNIYVSVTLLGKTENGQLDFRQGYTKLRISPKDQTLQVYAMLQPDRAGPGDEVTLEVQVQDAAGKPVQGEFSVAVVDKAIFALAQPNASPILDVFYGDQPLGVRSGISLAIAAWRLVELPGGLGGGGGEMPLSVIRQRFPDTAYWNGSVITDNNGKATIQLRLPDNVTTWKILVRGIDQTTRVGETEVELVATKPLLIQPVVPRAWVAGDHLLLAAVLHNNTSQRLETQVSLQSTSFLLDAGQNAAQTVTIPANGRTRVEWWGKVAAQGNMEILLSARASDLSDQVRIGGAQAVIQQATTKQTFSTVGMLEIAGSQVEVVSLPKSVSPQGGFLRVELNPSLAGTILGGLKTFDIQDSQSTEFILSRMLPNLAAYRLLRETKAESPLNQNELRKSIQDGISQLVASQRFDGSWSWWDQGSSDPLITAYVLFGLSQAKTEGFSVPKESLDRATQFLLSGVIQPSQAADGAALDRLAFIHFALVHAGVSDPAALDQLFERRAQLNPWAQALLAWALEKVSPGSEQAQTLRADLEGQALRSASGAAWQEQSQSWRMASYQLTVTAMTLYALASYDASTPLVADATRYLIANQRPTGGWGSSFSTAWAYLALYEVLAAQKEMQSNFEFSALLNGAPLVSGSAGENRMTTAIGEIPLERLYRDAPNALEIQRQAGEGRLIYRAILQAFVPIAGLQPVQRGFSISRSYRVLGDNCGVRSCPTVNAGTAGTRIEARLTLTIEKDAYYVMVKDYIPAGSELLDTRLLTTQLGLSEEELSSAKIDPTQPLKEGWGWQRFSQPQIYDDHIVWSAEYLPAGIYELRYILTLLQPGEYHLRPAEAWELYFPEVQGSSSGGVFTILP